MKINAADCGINVRNQLLDKCKVAIREIRIPVTLILVGFPYGSVDAKPKTDIIRRRNGRDRKADD